jgi:hypothetical protein
MIYQYCISYKLFVTGWHLAGAIKENVVRIVGV